MEFEGRLSEIVKWTLSEEVKQIPSLEKKQPL